MNILDITADSTPMYDKWGWDDHWGCKEWIEWHKKLVAKHGAKKADDIWAQAWLDGLSSLGGGTGRAPGANAVFDSVPVDCRTFNAEFRDYVEKRPVMKAAVFSGVGGFVGGIVSNGVKIVSTGAGAVGSAAGAVGSAADTASSLIKNLKWIIPVVAVAFLGYVGFRIYKEIKPAKA